MRDRRVGVLMGGWSAEREVSLRTGDGVAAALESRATTWSASSGSDDGAGLDERAARAPTSTSSSWRSTGAAARTGACRGCSSSWACRTRAAASSRARSRWTSSRPRRCSGCTTCRRRRTTWRVARDLADLEEVHGSFGFPAIVKPRREGSSVGLAKVGEPRRARRGRRAGPRLRRARPGRALRAATEVHVGHPRRARARRDRGACRRMASTTTARSTPRA